MTNEELVTKIKSGIDIAENMLLLWQQCRRYIYGIALHYQGKAELADLKQEGYLALYDAVDGFQTERGYKFLTYAEYWIRKQMVRYIQNNDVIRLPVHEKEKLREYAEFKNTYMAKHGKRPTGKEIARDMGVSETIIRNYERVSKMSNLTSLDSYIASDQEDMTVGETLTDERDIEAEILDKVQQEQLEGILWKVVDTLPDEQSKVLTQRYKEGATLKEIGDSIGVSPEKVRQLEFKATRNLRCPRNAHLLCSFWNESIESMAYRHNGVGEFNRTWTSSTELAAMKMMK